MSDHYASAQATNVGRELAMPEYSRIRLIEGVGQLVSQLAGDAEVALASAAALVDVVESGGEDDEIYSAALTLGGDLATAVATGYQAAAALQDTDFDARVSRVLTSPLRTMS